MSLSSDCDRTVLVTAAKLPMPTPVPLPSKRKPVLLAACGVALLAAIVMSVLVFPDKPAPPVVVAAPAAVAAVAVRALDEVRGIVRRSVPLKLELTFRWPQSICNVSCQFVLEILCSFQR